ncbi:MAG: hypothetical protein ACRDS0_40075 [Pseudonocardiaceae bacterium]
MAAASTDTNTATSGDGPSPRRRGKSKAPNFTYAGPVSVIRLELDATDDAVRGRLERQWDAVFRLRRALSATPRRGVGRIGRPIMGARLIPRRCGSGWG